jgi:single-strand DNA-binding protein
MYTLRNKVSMIGRLGAKPELKTLAGGYQVANCSIAINDRKKDKSGEWVENTQWHNLTAWGKLAENLVKLSDKGSEIAIDGKLVNKTYESKAGEKRYTTEIEIADFMVFKLNDATKK